MKGWRQVFLGFDPRPFDFTRENNETLLFAFDLARSGQRFPFDEGVNVVAKVDLPGFEAKQSDRTLLLKQVSSHNYSYGKAADAYKWLLKMPDLRDR